MTHSRIGRRPLVCFLLAANLLVTLTSAKSAEKVKGTLTYKGPNKTFTVVVTHAYLVKGPDSFDANKTVRRLVFSTSDFSAMIKGATALDGFDGKLREGMIVDLVDGPRLNYWIVVNDQRVQYSGSVEPVALKSTVDAPDHLAGKLMFDDSSAGGAKVEIEFDAPLLKSFIKTQ